ncbi:MAG: hypothetical protein IPK29_15575 [Betaproteobacteria bacterium]|nr:hypothetical protein [Betaproteobacteria bacterium]
MHLANKDSKVVAHIGARGGVLNLQLLARKFALTEVRINSARPGVTRAARPGACAGELGLKAVCFATAAEACAGADIIVGPRAWKPDADPGCRRDPVRWW